MKRWFRRRKFIIGILIGSALGWCLAPKPFVPEVGTCYATVDQTHKSYTYQIEKVIKADTRYVTTIFTFPNVDGYAKYKWYKSKGNLLDEVPLEWFKRTRQLTECPW